MKEELPSVSDVAKADDIELQEIMENAVKSTEDLNKQLENSPFEHLLCELSDFDKEPRSIRSSLKKETAKRFSWKNALRGKSISFLKSRTTQNTTMAFEKTSGKGSKMLNDDLKVRQESISLLKGRLTNQIMGIKETIAKVLDKDTSLAKKTQTQFREQGITITFILMTIAMTINIVVEALLPSGDAAVHGKGGGDGKPENVKEWLRNKLKALASQLGRLNAKAAEPLPGIIGAIISWILNRVKEAGHWVSQHLWALAVGVRGLL